MKIKNIIKIYIVFLMLLSQSESAKIVVFLGIPFLTILALRNPVRIIFFQKLFFLNVIIVIGFISGVINITENNIYYFFRDILYFVQAPIFIIIGMYCYKEINNLKVFLRIIVLSTLVVTVYKISGLIFNPSIFLQLGLESRYEFDLSNKTALITFFITFYSIKNNYNLFDKYNEIIIILISFLSVFLSFSRTFYALFLIIIIIPYINVNRTIYMMYGATVLFVLFVIFGGLFFEVTGGGTQGNTFESKVMHSLDEITVSNYRRVSDINQNWRGYEAYLGLSKFYEGNLAELFFGQGYGTVVITPYWIFKGDKLNILPIFHNGYITIILKTGLIGLFSFFIFLYFLLNMATKINFYRTSIYQGKLIGIFLKASVFIILFRTFVVHGIFTTSAPMLLLFFLGGIIQVAIDKK